MIRQLRALWWFGMFAFLAGTPSSWSVCDPDAAINGICGQLHQTEIKISRSSGGTNQAQLDTALLSSQVEETRQLYAKKLALKAEGIASAADVIKARAAYERSQLQLAAKKGLVKQALVAIDQQRKIAADIENRYRAQLARRGQIPLQNHKKDVFF